MVIEKLLEEFAKENFGDQEGNFFPFLMAETKK